MSPSPRVTKKCRDKYDVAVPFVRAIADVTGTPRQRRRNGGTPVDCSGRVTLRREHCDMPHKSRFNRDRDKAVAMQRLGKHVTAATNKKRNNRKNLGRRVSLRSVSYIILCM
jgi:hypothetical protein